MSARFCIFLMANCILFAATADAQQFRIETHVYRDGSEDPISENLTLFDENVIYDFMLKTDKTRFPQEIVIYLSNEKRFVLLDTNRQIKTEIIEGEVLKMLAALQNVGANNPDNKFFFQPRFDEDFDIGSGWLTLEGEQLKYRTRGERPPNDSVLHRYYEFIDQFARINVTDPRRMPPFARLKLNTAIKKYGFVPSRVEMTLTPTNAALTEQLKMYSEHFVIWELSEKDRRRIASAKRYWTEFKNVSLSEFRLIDTTDEPDQ